MKSRGVLKLACWLCIAVLALGLWGIIANTGFQDEGDATHITDVNMRRRLLNNKGNVVSGDTCNYANSIVVNVILLREGKTIFETLGLSAEFGANSKIAKNRKVANPLKLTLAQPLNGCQTFPSGSQYSNRTGVVQRGGSCSFLTKTQYIYQAGFDMALVLSNTTYPFTMACVKSDEEKARQILIPAVMIGAEEGAKLLKEMNTAPDVEIIVWKKSTGYKLDESALILWTIAVATVMGGAWFAAMEERLGTHVQNQDDGGERSRNMLIVSESDQIDVSMKTAASFVIMASITLVFLYFFLSKWINLLLIWIYVILGANALATICFHLICRYRPHLSTKTVHLPLLGTSSLCRIVVWSASLLLCMVWGLERSRTGMWVIQDLMGMAVIILLLCVIKIPNMKIATVLFAALVFYDVFWVFLSPFLFQGESVMVKVASGGGGKGSEPLPFLLKAPHFGHDSGPNSYSILGFGDVALPGLLVVFGHRLDIFKGNKFRNSYFLSSLLGYAGGLICTFSALVLMSGKGQPALLYLGPSMLLSIFLPAIWRNELNLVWQGLKRSKQENEEGDDVTDKDDSDGLKLASPVPKRNGTQGPSKKSSTKNGSGEVEFLINDTDSGNDSDSLSHRR